MHCFTSYKFLYNDYSNANPVHGEFTFHVEIGEQFISIFVISIVYLCKYYIIYNVYTVNTL